MWEKWKGKISSKSAKIRLFSHENGGFTNLPFRQTVDIIVFIILSTRSYKHFPQSYPQGFFICLQGLAPLFNTRWKTLKHYLGWKTSWRGCLHNPSSGSNPTACRVMGEASVQHGMVNPYLICFGCSRRACKAPMRCRAPRGVRRGAPPDMARRRERSSSNVRTGASPAAPGK